MKIKLSIVYPADHWNEIGCNGYQLIGGQQKAKYYISHAWDTGMIVLRPETVNKLVVCNNGFVSNI